MLQFNINVPSGVYAKYYFDLRALAGDNDLGFVLEPLDKERAMQLEVCGYRYVISNRTANLLNSLCLLNLYQVYLSCVITHNHFLPFNP